MTDDELSKQVVADLVELLTIERIDTDLYRGARQRGGIGRVFGGQVIAQALQAAQASTGAKTAHSLHAYFMRPGNEDLPIIYRVERDFDGRSFATRRVIASQSGQPILTMTASFQTDEAGLAHQDAMPDVPAPETLASDAAALGDPARLPPLLRRRLPVEFRLISPTSIMLPEAGPARQLRWFRLRRPIGDDPALHRAALAYASDFALMLTALIPHGLGFLSPGMQFASLDHALWLHEPLRADDWLLYDSDAPWAGHGRGINRGRIFTRDGRLVASVAQEGLMRHRA